MLGSGSDQALMRYQFVCFCRIFGSLGFKGIRIYHTLGLLCNYYIRQQLIILNTKMLNPNPQTNTRYFSKQYCKKHPDRVYQYICNNQTCDYYLSLQCYQCLHDNALIHRNKDEDNNIHRCIKLTGFVKDFHEDTVNKLTIKIRNQIKDITVSIQKQIQLFCENLGNWYSPMDETTTEKELVYTIVNSQKWSKIEQTADIKNSLINWRLKELAKKFKNQIQQIAKLVNQEMMELKYKPVPLQWKFDRDYTHELLNISGFKDRIVDKKVQKAKFCVALLNQPLTPQKNQITFTINSQNPYEHFVVLGVCSKKQIFKMSYQTDLKKGIYAIYQAAKPGSSNNALSLHSSDDSMHYKEAVGWNFRSGDFITVSLTIISDEKVRIMFKKKKEVFDLLIRKQQAFLHPFVALYSAGDKVSIDFH